MASIPSSTPYSAARRAVLLRTWATAWSSEGSGGLPVSVPTCVYRQPVSTGEPRAAVTSTAPSRKRRAPSGLESRWNSSGRPREHEQPRSWRSNRERVCSTSIEPGSRSGISTKSRPAPAAPEITRSAPSGVHSSAQIKAWAPKAGPPYFESAAISPPLSVRRSLLGYDTAQAAGLRLLPWVHRSISAGALLLRLDVLEHGPVDHTVCVVGQCAGLQADDV